MTEEEVQKSKVNAFFKYIRSHANNRNCFDCNKVSPIWASTTFGIFICTDCAAKHREMGVNISKVKSTLLDKWNLRELRRMYVSGNSKACVLGDSSDLRMKYTNGAKYVKELDQVVKQNEVAEPGESFLENLSVSRKFAIKANKVEIKNMPRFSDRVVREKSEDKIMERYSEPVMQEKNEGSVKVFNTKNKFVALKKSNHSKLKNINAPSGRLGFGAFNISDAEKSDE